MASSLPTNSYPPPSYFWALFVEDPNFEKVQPIYARKTISTGSLELAGNALGLALDGANSIALAAMSHLMPSNLFKEKRGLVMSTPANISLKSSAATCLKS